MPAESSDSLEDRRIAPVNSAKDSFRVGSTCLPHSSTLGRAIQAFESVDGMGLSDFDLNPGYCEMTIVEPRHILSEDQKITKIRGYDNGHSIQEPLMTALFSSVVPASTIQ
jgi:hypothetical protein